MEWREITGFEACGEAVTPVAPLLVVASPKYPLK